MSKLYTHVNPDLDAHFACWLVKSFIPYMAKAEIVYRGADWDGVGMNHDDMAVDMQAGGHGIKGIQDPDGTVHSCVASLASKYLSAEDQEAIRELISFVDIQDANGSVVHNLISRAHRDARKIFALNNIGAILRAFDCLNQNDPVTVSERMSEIFNGYLRLGRAKLLCSNTSNKNLFSYLLRWMTQGSEYVWCPEIGSGRRASVSASRYLKKEDADAIRSLINFVDFYDSHNSVANHLIRDFSEEVKRFFDVNSVGTVLRAIEHVHSDDLKMISRRMFEIFDGFLEMGRADLRAILEADRAKLFARGKVALVKDKREKRTDQILWERGVQAIVYDDGHNIGVLRRGEGVLLKDGTIFRADHPEIKKVVEKAKDNRRWFDHPKGFLYCHGSRKAPASSKSNVNPHELIEVISKLLL